MTTATDTLRTDAIAQYRVLGEETDPGLEALARLAATVCATSAAAVNLIDDRLQHTVAVVGIQPGVCRRDDSMCAVVFEDGQTVVVDDARADARFADNPFVTGPLGHVRFYASSPLITPDGVAIGTLCVFGDDVAELNATQAEGLELLARQAVDVLELRRHSHELVRSNDQLTQFAARISHDRRTPLTAIAGQIELAADALAADDTEGAIRSLSHAEAAAGRMDGMITSLLAFARLGGARPQRPCRRRTGQRPHLAPVAPAGAQSGGVDPAGRVAFNRKRGDGPRRDRDRARGADRAGMGSGCLRRQLCHQRILIAETRPGVSKHLQKL